MATTTIAPVRAVSPQNLVLLSPNPATPSHLSAMQPDCITTSGDITPRQYQEEIFIHARHSNVIAVLGTGSGKTYISILLIKSITSQSHLPAGKIVVFLVPKVPLVEQQSVFIEKQLPSLRVRKVHGGDALAGDMLNRAEWKKFFDSADIVVMTAQVFVNALTHSHWSIDKVSLLIFDECHHTRLNHPYNVIMRDSYKHCSPSQRPKIFGMTASVVWRPSRAQEDLQELEANLDAKAITVQRHHEELGHHSPKPKETLCEYPLPPTEYVGYPYPRLYDRLEIDIKAARSYTLPATPLDDPAIPWAIIDARYATALRNLGPYAAETFLYNDLSDRLRHVCQPSQADEMSRLRSQLQAMHTESSTPEKLLRDPEMRQIYDLITEYSPLFETPGPVHGSSIPSSGNQFPPGWVFDMSWCSPKVHVLVEVLRRQFTPASQGIVFVEQRHVASGLARLLSRVDELKGVVRCAEFVGHASDTGEGMKAGEQNRVLESFRKHSINLLIATQVAEEGLDFPACDVVVRFDSIQHLVGFVQSRGRARHKDSTFVIMVEHGDETAIERYKRFAEIDSSSSVSAASAASETPTNLTVGRGVGPDEDDEPNEVDLVQRERLVVSDTKAVLSYNNAIDLLSRLCALIPTDNFTRTYKPTYITNIAQTGYYVCSLTLPSALPLPHGHLKYTGPGKCSKKEAKRAVAFLAVKALHGLNVFDEYLLPARSIKDMEQDAEESASGATYIDVKQIPQMMNVDVRDPFVLGIKMWLHTIYVDGERVAGLVTGTHLPQVELSWEGTGVRTGTVEAVAFDEDPLKEDWQRQVLQEFMAWGLWWCVTTRPLEGPLTCFLVPLVLHENQPDFELMERIVAIGLGCSDCTQLSEKDFGRLLCTNRWEHGRSFILHRIRYDLTPSSMLPEGSMAREAGFTTYGQWLRARYKRKKFSVVLKDDEVLVEARRLKLQCSGIYHLHSRPDDAVPMDVDDIDTNIFPLSSCRWTAISTSLYRTFGLLPRLLHRINDVFRAQSAQLALGLPPINTDLLIEASTIPAARTGWNNQRFETLGDSVLKLCTSVHVFNKYPWRHEGQLSVLRQVAISNMTLLRKAKAVSLESFLNTESTSNETTWRYCLPSGPAPHHPCHPIKDTDRVPLPPPSSRPRRLVHRRFPRRSLQDCMEATLGAAYATGGIPMALLAGTALGLNFGGSVPWLTRFGKQCESSTERPGVLFNVLQERLGYTFRNPELLVEAMTHPSFATGGQSYQRLEFLGDAVIDLTVMSYLYNKFPSATSGKLSTARARAVSAPVLSSIAIKHLGLHKLMLVNETNISIAMGKYIPTLEETSYEDMVLNAWAHDPPKAISDVLESLLGAVFVDSGWNWDLAQAVAEGVMNDVLELLSPDTPKDPVSELMVWTAKAGCTRICLRKSRSREDAPRNDTINVVVHDVDVSGPFTASSIGVARAFASERARIILQDVESPHSLQRVCTCKSPLTSPDPGSTPDTEPLASTLESPNPDTEEGYTAIAREKLEKFQDPEEEVEKDRAQYEEDVNREEEEQVEKMIMVYHGAD